MPENDAPEVSLAAVAWLMRAIEEAIRWGRNHPTGTPDESERAAVEIAQRALRNQNLR